MHFSGVFALIVAAFVAAPALAGQVEPGLIKPGTVSGLAQKFDPNARVSSPCRRELQSYLTNVVAREL
ncbi:hypothetical protein EIP91_002535 [Steccherinum ochraceum]|uniref:Uncharacterized protein n=1 Tax=Steccherinum ochraceum TaxID=92696 RepID=A0A4V2MWA4_9APHY|nr:hypothetical protein EIP91_002535 [Steccherinum ochraceum]